MFAFSDLGSQSVHSCSLMSNKYTCSEAQQPPLFKPPLPAMVGLAADFTCDLEKCVVAAGQAQRQRFHGQASPVCNTLAGSRQEKAVALFLTWQRDELPACWFCFMAKRKKCYSRSCTFIWGSSSERTEMN